MAVLVEALSIVVRRAAISKHYSGGWHQFLDDVPNGTLCYDDELARVGFMTPPDVGNFIAHLESEGLQFVSDGRFQDCAVVDQVNGPTMPVDWLEFAKLPIDESGTKVSACWLFEGPRVAAGVHMPSKELSLATPIGWTYDGSLSAEFQFVSNEDMGDKLRFLRREAGKDVYLDLSTGREAFVSRTTEA